MCRGWKGVALMVACLGLSVPARAQSSLPSQLGAARMPEPIPEGPAPNGPPPAPPPNLVPGPISPLAAPVGPPDCLSLPADHSSAFQCENFVDDAGMYVHLGPMALQHYRLGAGGIAVLDPQQAVVAANNGVASTINTGLSPPPGVPVAQRYNDLVPPLTMGLRGTVGFVTGQSGFEYTAFYIWQNNKTIDTASPGALDGFFYNAPPGFRGIDRRGLWLQADRISTTFGSSLWSNEFNYRRWNTAVSGFEFLFGVRYINENENLSIYTDHSGITFPANGLPFDPRLAATYQVLTHNNILVPQLGGEYNLQLLRWLSIGGWGKAGAGANFVDTKTFLTRGDGLRAFRSQFDDTVFGQAYELGAFVDIHILDRLRFRAGYQALWLVNIATAVDQVNFNLGGARSFFIPPNMHNTNGSTLFSGPLIELQFFF